MNESGASLAIVVKGYPRVSETFIARELEALNRRGVAFSLHALRHPAADAHLTGYASCVTCDYLPEYLHEAPLAVARSVGRVAALPFFFRALGAFRADAWRDPRRARVRRFGQACVLASRLGRHVRHVHCHFAHSPASVTRYAALMLGASYSISAHAKDVWTDPPWDLEAKLRGAKFVVTCNEAARERLLSIYPGCNITLLHHGVDRRLVVAAAPHSRRDGQNPAAPVRLLSVARAVEKKGLLHLIDAIDRLAGSLHVQLEHYGDGPLHELLRHEVRARGLQSVVHLHGARPHAEIIAAMDRSDIFVFPADIGSDGDRDGLPNALLEANARGLCVVACDAGSVREAVDDGTTGVLVPRGDFGGLISRLAALCRNPAERARLANTALEVNAPLFDGDAGHDQLAVLLRAAAGAA